MSDIFERLKAALVDRYAIERELGSGGMATVYLAEDLKHERKVAIKVLHPELAAALGADRFLREIKITARLNHPHILPLLDSGEADGFLYYVMPYVEGESLRDRLNREQQLPLDDAVQMTREVADALGSAHSHDVVHRDIKPENILLEEGHAVVADFGIARAITTAGGKQLTHTGLAVGTPAYMSPEQAAGSGRLDGRTDVYSLGCVLYEMLAGAPPFTGDTAQEVISKRFTDAVPPLSARRHNTPPDLELVLMKALASTPDDRFASAADFARALTGTRTQVSEGGAGRALRGVPRLSRKTGISLAAGVAAVGLVIGLLQWKRSSDARVAAVIAELQPAVDEGRLDAVDARLQAAGIPLSDRRLAGLAARVAGAISITSDPPGATVVVTRVEPVAGSADREPVSIGRTPVEVYPLVAGEYLVRLTHQRTNELTFLVRVEVGSERRVARRLVFGDEASEGAVVVNEGWSPVQRSSSPVPEFLIGRHEVTNAEYLAFVTSGGYQNPAFWPETLIVNARRVPWASALETFADRSGLPGPRGWTGGRFPSGTETHPVVGVSWYEASAYARWAGKALPSWDQWWRAAIGDSLTVFPWGNDVMTTDVRANFGLMNPHPVGTHPLGVSPFGCFDMAGNVREWLGDGAAEGARRVVVGGSWQDPTYMFEPSHAEWFVPAFAGEAIGFRVVHSP